MKIEILLRRQAEDQPMPRTIRAYILVNGRPNHRNLLSRRRIVREKNAKAKVLNRVQDLFSGKSFVPSLEVEFREEL